MIGNKRNFSLSVWDHDDNFLCILKSADLDFDGQSYNENFQENITGEKTLTFSIPMYIFDMNSGDDINYDKTTDKQYFKQNKIWRHIYNEQKIRYIEYNAETQKKERVEEFVLKNYTESRDGEQKIANCVCESLAVYELGKIGWGITFDEAYVTVYDNYEIEDRMTLDYWMRKLLYKETNLGRVSNTTECTYLLQGIQLRDEEGYAIDSISYEIDEDGNYKHTRINEPICTTTSSQEYIKYNNPTGWTWEIIADFENDPEKQGISKLYENPVINKFIEGPPNFFYAQSYQKRIGQSDENKILRKHPIPENELNEWTYVTNEKRHLMSVERSNIFSIIQDLCEEFGVWAYFNYEYDNDGKISARKIIFKTEAIDSDIKFDFAYGKNLQSCSRILDSSDLITKLYVTNTDSVLVDGGILSIQQATANPTSENYIYNFNYFYETHMLSKESEKGVNSDEYKINLHCGKLRKINDRITNTQKYLAPLYDRQLELQSNLTIQEGAKAGFVGNISDIESKIAAIPPGDRLIKSWVEDYTEYNHVGESKTFSLSTNVDLGGECKYLNFGRDDVLIGNITSIKNYGKSETETLPGFIPRIYSFNNSWKGKSKIDDNDESYFTLLNNSLNCRYDYSEFGDGKFIKGIYFKKDYHNPNYEAIPNYGRVRFKYAPLAYYYLLIQDYQKKIEEVNKKIDQLEDQLKEVNNKIFAYELEVKSLLKDKNELILQFEKEYKPYIREGYWEPSDYKAQSINKIFYAGEQDNSFDGLVTEVKYLKNLNLNDSITNYTRYFSLGNAANIKIDSIKEMSTLIPTGGDMPITRMKGLNFELYLDNNNNLIVAIAPDLITKYQLNNYEDQYYEGTISYEDSDGIISTTTKHWDIVPNDLAVKNNYIYLSNDNIITNSLKVYGGHSTNEEDELLQYSTIPDWSYSFESTAYDSDNHRVDISDTIDAVVYDYSLKIQLKLTNKVIQYLTVKNPVFTVSYNEETTLQYLYNDATLMSDKYSMPKSEYSISVVDLSTLNGFEYYKPKVGQQVPIWDVEMGLRNFQGFITSVSFPLEEKHNTQIEIATYNTKFEDIFQKLTATVTDVKYNENELYHAADAFEAGTGAIKTDVFQKSLKDNFNRIQLGVNNEITIDKATGITLKDLDNGSGVKIIGNGIFLTEDINKPSESIEWKTGITGYGINASAVTAGHIDTQQIYIYNASQDQMRFIWNRDGLFAYGDKFNASDEYISQTTDIDSDTDLIDYNKYVKFNEQGLDFNDNGKSALKLGWKGLSIQTQQNALSLDADNGLSIQQYDNGNIIKRLELGHLRTSTGIYTDIYGLKLYDTSGSTTVQTDSNGELWLKKKFQIGGSINEAGVVQNANAGVYGEDDNVSKNMQMGYHRNENGNFFWDPTPLRFWAGPRTTTEIATDEPDLWISQSTEINQVGNNAPTLARFRVDANGKIVASGIDVGGWIGGGTFLRSKSHEAVLRSSNYLEIVSGTTTVTNPVIAVGQPTLTLTKLHGYISNNKIVTNNNNNLIVYCSVTSEKEYTFNREIVHTNNPVLIYGFTDRKPVNNISLNNVVIANTAKSVNFTVPKNQTYFVAYVLNNSNYDFNDYEVFVTNNNINNYNFRVYKNGDVNINKSGSKYNVGINSPSISTDITFYAGTILDDPEFYVRANGEIKATKLTIAQGQVNGLTSEISTILGDIDGISTSFSTLNNTVNKVINLDPQSGLTIYTVIDGLSTSMYGEDGVSTKIYNISNLTDTNLTIVQKIDSLSTLSATTRITNIVAGAVNLSNIGGFTNTTTGDSPGLTASGTSGGNYYVGMMAPQKLSDYVFYAGTTTNIENNAFWVKADGTVTANALNITGGSIKLGGTSVNPNFQVTNNGDVYFKGGIYGWSSQGFKQGLSDNSVNKLYTADGSAVDIEICQGLIIDIR